jgi:hypothetical protein
LYNYISTLLALGCDVQLALQIVIHCTIWAFLLSSWCRGIVFRPSARLHESNSCFAPIEDPVFGFMSPWSSTVGESSPIVDTHNDCLEVSDVVVMVADVVDS